METPSDRPVIKNTENLLESASLLEPYSTIEELQLYLSVKYEEKS